MGTRRTAGFGVPASLTERVGIGASVVALSWLVARARPVDGNVIGFGIRGGMLVTFDTKRADVGAFDDTASTRLTRVLDGAWGPRELIGRGAPAVTVTLSALGPNRVTVRGVVRGATGGDRPDAPILLLVKDPARSEILCRVGGTLGTATVVPQDCLASPGDDGPGIRRTLGFEADGDLVVTTIDVDDGVVVVEAETMHNSMDDSGYEAFYTLGPTDEFASNGVSMQAHAIDRRGITLDRDVALPAARYDVWVLTRAISPHVGTALARLALQSEQRTFAEIDPRSRSLSSWDSNPRWEWLPAGRVDGGGTRKIGVTFQRIESGNGGLGDLDAMAFVPAPG
jgi:hypothetical protein